MASTATDLLRFELQAFQDNIDSWGTVLNNLFTRIEDAIAASVPISTTGGDTTLTTVDYSEDQARKAILLVSGTLASNATITVPDLSKIYAVRNDTTGSFTLTVKTSAGSGVVIQQGFGAIVVCDGTDCLSIGGDVFSSSAQTLTNKSIDADNNTITNIGFPELNTNLTDTLDAFIGCGLDTKTISVTSDGATITLSMEKSGGGDVRYLFAAGVITVDCTPAATVTLTAGTDTSPALNYVYVLGATGVLTASTSGWPSAEHAHVATVVCQSAASLQADGAYKVHNWTDHTQSVSGSNIQGHVPHINEWIRSQNATWLSGIALTPTITTNGGAEDNIDIAVSSGTVLQLHDHAFPAFDTSSGSDIYVVNNFSTPYAKITDLNAANTDDAGNSVANNSRLLLVIWGIVSEDSADCKLMVNLPGGFYNSDANAIADTSKYANYNIPSIYRGTGFLIARLCLRYQTAASGTWSVVENLDLRGQFPSVFAGGSAALSTQFADTAFRVFDDGDSTKQIAFQASGITTATTRTLTVQDVDGTVLVTGGTDVAIADGGTGASTASAAFTALKQAATTSATGVVELATDAEVRSAATGVVVLASQIESASAAVALTDAATVAVNWDSGVNFTVTLTANRVIGNPTNGQPGTWRTILVQGDDATDRTITFDTQYLGDVPTITDCDSTRWYLLMIYCITASHFVVSAKRAFGS